MLGEHVAAALQVAAPMGLGGDAVSRAKHLDQLAVVPIGTLAATSNPDYRGMQ